MTTQPARAAMGANSFERLAPALNNAKSMPQMNSSSVPRPAISSPRKLNFFARERLDASNVSFSTGKFRFFPAF